MRITEREFDKIVSRTAASLDFEDNIQVISIEYPNVHFKWKSSRSIWHGATLEFEDTDTFRYTLTSNYVFVSVRPDLFARTVRKNLIDYCDR